MGIIAALVIVTLFGISLLIMFHNEDKKTTQNWQTINSWLIIWQLYVKTQITINVPRIEYEYIFFP